ncbi:DEAD/DEAH box helicase, partial [Streptococcus suis]
DFATSPDIEVMIINSQAFNARGKDARRIHMAQESMAYQVPMDVIAMTRPIVIIDEPQSVEGKQTKKNLKDFKPLFTLRYSATHKDKHDMLYRLDAMDAYNQQLVKKIAVKSIAQTNLMGTSGYLYLQALIPQAQGAP